MTCVDISAVRATFSMKYASLFRQKHAVKKQANKKNKDKYITREITQYQILKC